MSGALRAANGLAASTALVFIVFSHPEICLGEASVAGASSPEAVAAEPGSGPAAAPVVGLDRLLRLPTSYQATTNRYGGSTATNWRARFVELDTAAEQARQNLSDAQTKLENTAASSSQWQMGAPGLGSPDAEHATVSYKLRAQIRELRDDVVTAERAHKELIIEADLAGVPPAWRRLEGQMSAAGPGAPQ